MVAPLIRRQVLKTQDAKPADPCQRQRWSLNNDGFICLKGTPLVLGLAESSNEVKDLDIFGFFMYRLISYAAVWSRLRGRLYTYARVGGHFLILPIQRLSLETVYGILASPS